MRISEYFGRTLRESPGDAEVVGHQLLIRAGFIRQLGAGIFIHLHLAQRSMEKIQRILREEIDAIGGQEICMPVIHPAEIWKETGRWYQIGSEMGRFKDKNERDMVLAMTHEEVVAFLVRTEIQSYKHLPRLIYHLQTKWRDDPRPRAGLIRVREFTMKDSYSLDADVEGLDRQYRAHYQAYFNIFHRCGLPVIAVKSDVGMMGGRLAHEFMYLSEVGEDTLLLCDACGYTANRQVAKFHKHPAPAETALPIQKIATPGITTISDLAKFLAIAKSRTAKVVFMVAKTMTDNEDRDVLVLALVRGDMDVNETKLANAVHAKELRPAHEDEIRAVGSVPGYASPVSLKEVLIVIDDILPESPNLVTGANEVNFHLLNVNYARDYVASIVADIASAEDGSLCPICESPMRASRGVEVGNIFKLGTRYSDAMGCTFLDKDGKSKPVVMGSYGIGVGRTLACVAEQYRDERGLMLPITVAPYSVYLIALGETESLAEEIYGELLEAGVEVLYDDREESPGVKFADADLIGLPIRLIVSPRSIKAGGAELKLRRGGDSTVVQKENIVTTVRGWIATLEAEVAELVTPVSYRE